MIVSVRIKLLASALFAVAMTLVVGAAGYVGIVRVDDAMDEAVDNAKALRSQMQTDMGHDALRGDVYAAFFEGLLGSGGAEQKSTAAVRARGAEMIKSLEAAHAAAPADVKAEIDKVKPEVQRFIALAAEVTGLAFSDIGGARQKLPEFIREFAALEKGLEAVSDRIQRSTEEAQARSDREAHFARFAIVAVCLLAMVALTGISLLQARGILRPLDSAVRVSTAVAAGDLTVPIDASAKDDFGRLLGALEKMRRDLAEAVGEIQRAAQNVKTGSREIARGNADLSSRTEEQASSLEETASSMEELTTAVKHNTDSAHQANQLAIGASNVAARGGEAMRGVVETMNGISEASRRIADIITVIDGISFQTNILALNAAVEAARAGEQGRGFAVVATEVRALAQRSATAAKEIKSLIEESVGRVEQGTRQVEGAGETMREIVASVRQVTTIVSEIAAASQEQLRGIEQVSRAVMQMDQVVQQNAALVEESAAAAENLASQSELTAATVGRFKLDQAGFAASIEPANEALAEPRAARTGGRHVTIAPRVKRGSRAAAVAPPSAAAEEDAWREF